MKNCLPFTAIYHQITRFIQGYVDNEVNLNADHSCKQTCADYKNTKSYGCEEKTMCAEYAHIDQASTRCTGTIYNCDYVDDDLTVCPVIILYIKQFKVTYCYGILSHKQK